MNPNIEKLYAMAAKPHRLIIGLMAGTSLDGLDIAYCKYTGSGPETEVEILAFETMSFDESTKDEIRKIFAKADIDFQHLCLLNPWIGNLHGSLINDFLQKNQISEVDCIASHGQTVFHAPKIQHGLSKFPNGTLQIGDGDHIAVKTGITTLSDFRQKHCAAGGEGAPLAVYGDFLIFSKKGSDRILLNMGGISNFTFLSGDLDANKVFATDTGPGNTIIDKLVQTKLGIPYDDGGKLASEGIISEALLSKLLSHDFFKKALPKTTGPEVFNVDFLEKAMVDAGQSDLSIHDTLATLCMFTAISITECIKLSLPDNHADVFLSGGGMHNPVIVQHLKTLMPNNAFFTTDEIGINGDAKEAILFATLANEALAGGRTHYGERLGVPSVSMGKVSFPS